MIEDSIAFIGGGNMATSLIGGLIAEGYPRDGLWVTDVDDQKLSRLQDRFQVNTTGDNQLVISRAATIVLAVKPQVIGSVIDGIASAAKTASPLIVSIAAGVREPDMRRHFGYEAAIVRTMPNTPALLQCGASALYANPFVNAEQRSRAENVMRAVGITVWVDDESILDAVTALSGSGPAYFFRLMEIMEDIGVDMGLSRESARNLTVQTALGAARMATETGDPPSALRKNVTSPGGTTQAALESLDAGGMANLMARALEAARKRAIELGVELGHDK